MREIKPRKRIVGNEAPDGYLFGSAAKFPTRFLQSFNNLVANVKRERRFGIEKKLSEKGIEQGAWDYHSEPLENYAGDPQGKKHNLSEILASRIKKHNEFKLEPFRILDAGIGTGKQWFDFARTHGFVIGRDFEIFGTSLTRNGVIPEMKSKVKLCTANNIHLKFREEKPFDFVVSHYGMHEMEEAGIESAFRVVKPGGELFVSGVWTRVVPKLTPSYSQYAALVKSYPEQSTILNGPTWFLHLKKK